MAITKRRYAIIAGTIAAAMVGTGVGVAFWTTTSPPATGSAEAGEAEQVTIAQVGTITGLAPGGPSQPIDFRITNPAAFPQQPTTATVTITDVTPGSVPGDLDGDCPASEFTITSSPITLSPATPIAGNNGTRDYFDVARIALTETGANQNACQNAVLELTFQVTG